MGHYSSEMPDIEMAQPSASVKQLRDWIDTTVDVLREHGGTMEVRQLQKVAAKVIGISEVRMPYVVNNAVADHRISWVGPRMFDKVTIV